MKILTVANRKGGVGKTTVAVHLAAAMAMKGYRVGIVDLDSQGHVAVTMGLEKLDALYNVLVDQHLIEESVRLVPPEHYAPTAEHAHGELLALLSDRMTYRIPYMLEQASAFVILDMLENFGVTYDLDYIVVDTPPTMSLLDTALYAATDGYIFVTECEALSFDGIIEIQDQIAEFADQRRRYMNRDTHLLGIVPNRMRADTILHRTNISNLAESFPNLVFPPIILRIAWAEAFNIGQLIYTYAPDGKEADDAWRVVNRIEERLKQVWPTVPSEKTQ